MVGGAQESVDPGARLATAIQKLKRVTDNTSFRVQYYCILAIIAALAMRVREYLFQSNVGRVIPAVPRACHPRD